MTEAKEDKERPERPEFWDKRYCGNHMPWDLGHSPGLLREFLKGRPPGRALIPGCGNGYEVETFHNAGWKVDAVDFSRAAVARAKAMLGNLGAHVRLADFFQLASGPYDLIYERTFLCSQPPGSWTAWANQVRSLLAPYGILAGFFYFGPESEPPPFPVSEAKLHELLGREFEVMVDRPVADSLPLYEGKERWQVWQRKSPEKGSIS
jgi:SAM-dependent methyltransferase